MVRYCSRDCQVAHRPQHKKACKKRAAELFDEELFKDPPEREECPICMLPLPFDDMQIMFQACCGKDICLGCIHAQRKENNTNAKLCPFCRTPAPATEKEAIEHSNRRVERKDALSMKQLAICYRDGVMGLQKDSAKALKLFLEAGKRGCTDAYYNAGNFYYFGVGVEKDMKRAKYYWELGAVGGSIYSIQARHNLGNVEAKAGNHERAYKHLLISAKAGNEESLKQIKMGVKLGLVAKEKYAEAIRLCQKQHDDTRSAMRIEALAYEANPSMYLNSS